MVATSSLGAGIDIKDIRIILHLNLPYTLLDYAQESGRSGRDQQPSRSILITNRSKSKLNDSDDPYSTEQLAEFVESGNDHCIRVYLDTYLDGPELATQPGSSYQDQNLEQTESVISARISCSTDEKRCSYCLSLNSSPGSDIRPDTRPEDQPLSEDSSIDSEDERQVYQLDQTTKLAASRMDLMDQDLVHQLERFKQMMIQIGTGCSICYYDFAKDPNLPERDRLSYQSHQLSDCSEDINRSQIDLTKDIRSRMTKSGLEGYGGCFNCLQPRTWCLSSGNQNSCRFGRLNLVGLLVVHYFEENAEDLDLYLDLEADGSGGTTNLISDAYRISGWRSTKIKPDTADRYSQVPDEDIDKLWFHLTRKVRIGPDRLECYRLVELVARSMFIDGCSK